MTVTAPQVQLRYGDKVLDAADQCPDAAGTADTKGCPAAK